MTAHILWENIGDQWDVLCGNSKAQMLLSQYFYPFPIPSRGQLSLKISGLLITWYTGSFAQETSPRMCCQMLTTVSDAAGYAN